MALRRSATWSMLALLLAAGTALAADPTDWADDRKITVAEVADAGELDAGYIFAWPEWCVTPEGGLRWHLRHGGTARTSTSTGTPLCESASAAPAQGPAIQSAGEAWASPARGQGQFRSATSVQMDGIGLQAALVLFLQDMTKPPAEDLPPPQVMPDLALDLPIFPAYEPAPSWPSEEAAPERLDASEAHGIKIVHPASSDFQVAAKRIRAGIAGSAIQTEKVVVAGLILVALGVALYQRITPARSIQHETRAQIRQFLMERPGGATAGEVGRVLGMNRKTADYHLNYLARLGTLRTGMDEHGARLYSLKAIPPRQTVVERMLLLVRQRPGLSVPEAAEALGVSRSSADRYAKALVVSGSLESRLVSGERKLYERAG